MCLSLHEAASAIDSELNVHAHNEAAFSITQTPAQYLRPAVRALGVRARNRFASTIRSNLSELAILDTDTYNLAINQLDLPSRQWLGHHHSLGTWSDAKKQAVDPLNDGSCDYCGHETGDLIHLTWKCPFFQAARFRDDHGLAAIDPSMLPQHLLLGLPSEFGASVSAYACDLRGHNGSQPLLPILPFDHPLSFNAGIHNKGLALLDANRGEWKNLTARQAMDRLRNGEAIQALPIGSPCQASAPVLPNVWTDGAKTVPARPQWSLAAFGIWHPDREAGDAQILETSIGSIVSNEFTSSKLAIAGVLSGTRSSSTRAEIAAGLAAMIAPGPVHIGTDSQAFASKLQTLLQCHAIGAHGQQGKQPQKPFSLHKDGDLWQAIDRTIAIKGHHAISISWYKAHAKLEHLLNGTATPSSLVHNHIADLIADQGNEQAWWHTGTLELSKYYEARQEAYIQLLKRIHAMQMRVLTCEKETREERIQQAANRARIDSNRQTKPKGLANRCFLAPSIENGIILHIRKPNLQNLDPEETTLQPHLYLFFKFSRWVPTTMGL